VKGKGLKQGPFVGEQEFLGIVEAAAHDEVIEHEERELIESVIEFGDTIVREIMKPRPDFVSVTNLTTIKNALDEAFEHGVSRLPVLIEDEDGNEDVLGLAFTKDLMQHERKGLAESLVSTVVRPATVIPENKPVSKLMREMQRDHFHLAIVADEYGSIVGLVTLEDCLEELVGDIIDEHDDEDQMVRSLSNGEFLVDGAMSISDFNEQFDLELPDEDWDTVGGFVFATLEHVPRIGESIDFDGWKFVAEEVEGRRIRRVRVSPVLEREENPRRDGVS
jgi:CBS domain containing-hemolysin-like protein